MWMRVVTIVISFKKTSWTIMMMKLTDYEFADYIMTMVVMLMMATSG